MMNCAFKGCRYRTQVSARMLHHQQVSGHGRIDTGKKKFRGDQAFQRKNKGKNKK